MTLNLNKDGNLSKVLNCVYIGNSYTKEKVSAYVVNIYVNICILYTYIYVYYIHIYVYIYMY